MEEMIPELEDMEKRGYFNKAEIRQIVKRRTDFEYSLKRRAAVKADYLRYIQYESDLDELRKLRKDAMGLEGKRGLADTSMTKRIHFIYQRATQKFRGDLRLWSAWLQYCKDSNSMRKLSQVVTKALQLHPREASLWIYASAWEFEHNRNAGAARALMQRGLRMCPGKADLWAEYFRMELLYAHTLRTRRKVLGITPAGSSQDEAGEGAAGKESEAAVQMVLNGAIATVVYKQATAELPKEVATRKRFLDILSEFSFPGVAPLYEAIYSSLEADFPEDPEAWDLLARRWLTEHPPHQASTSHSPPEESAIATFERALAATQGPQMYDLYRAFLTEQLGKIAASEGGRDGAPPKLKGRSKQLAKALLEVCGMAAAEGRASEALLLEWPRLALRFGRVKAALEAAARACQTSPGSAPLWQQRLLLQAQQISSQGDVGTAKILEALVLEAVRSVPKHDAAELWIVGFRTLKDLSLPLDCLVQQLVHELSGSSKGPLQGGMGNAAAAAVQAVRDASGLPVARELYRQLLKVPPAGGSLMHAVLDMEMEHVSEQEALSNADVDKIFEAAVDAYGSQDADLWMKYVQSRLKRGKSVGDLYWRASRTLHDPAVFMLKYEALQLAE
ncbi:g2589 [Coccomyxa elongata]